ncbi:MAG: ATP-binding protein [Ascidiaceihabitans sp.]|nr:ATP-binding protein [Ascidiaceihabitans sp.]
MPTVEDDRVSRRRYQREQRARAEAEELLENKSRELFLANQKLSEYSGHLETAVLERTTELRQALVQAEAASAVRTRFVATMSHEIRTPLGGMLGMIDLLEMDEDNPEKLEFLKNARISGQALSRIVNDVLDFSKMEAGVFVFEDEGVDIRALIGSVIAMAGANLISEGRMIESKVDLSVPPLFFGDATRIRQVISNLVSNAVNYSTDGIITVCAKSTPHAKGILLRVEVQDFGIGIDKEQLGNLFKDFSQISNSLTAAARGTGLGLAISKRIVEGCGGAIGVDSTPGFGSTFWFEIPAEVLATPQIVEAEHTLDEEFAETFSLKGTRVLLAEDNAINQKLLLTYLDRMGVEAVLAENGRIAVEKFEPGLFDLILMDVAMPEMDGLEATGLIRKSADLKDIPPVIVLTAHVMDAIQEEASVVGVDTVLCKPIPFRELKAAMIKTLGRSLMFEPVHEEASVPAVETLVKAAPRNVTALMSGPMAEDLLLMFSQEDLSQLVSKYVADGQETLTKISEAHGLGQAANLRENAHYLKGSSLLMGFNRVAALCTEVEDNAVDISASRMLGIGQEMSDLFSEILDHV